MLRTIGLLLLFVSIQVLAEQVPVQFIENVKKDDVQDRPSRIVSGWEALPGQLPHQVSIRMVAANGAVTSCGGSVVHRDWVLTAAHCTAQQVTLVIRAGVVNLQRPAYMDETYTWYNHPTYNDHLVTIVQPNDISIVKLRTPLTYSPLIKAIKIQSQLESHRDYGRTNEVFYTSGFGRTWTGSAASEVLNWVYLRAVSNLNCASLFGAIITDNTICAQNYNVTSQSVCQGDSGGPLVHVGADGVPVLVGVTSFVAGDPYGCHSGFPAGFTRPGPFLSWLEQTTGIDFENLDEEHEISTLPPSTTTQEPLTTTEEPTVTEEPSTTTQLPSTTTEGTTSTTTQAPEETEEESSSSESEEDKELSDLMKRLEVEVKVKVKMDKLKKKTKVHEIVEK